MYVVTGATGNTGSVIANGLLAKGQKVRAIGRNPERLKLLASRGAEPFVADITDTDSLTRAFSGAKAVYVMLPPDIHSNDYQATQERIAESLTRAIERSGVQHAVLLSSMGADKSDKTGPVLALHNFEQRLSRLPNLNVLNLRPAYFMENTLEQIGIIHDHGIAAGPLRPDLRFPMIATRDIGAYAADALLNLNFRGNETRELLGQRDLTMTEATSIIGKAIGKADLKYVQLPDEQLRPAMEQAGLSKDLVNLLLEMLGSMNSGHMRALEERTPQNTTPTTFEVFVADQFLPIYKNRLAAA